MLETGRFFILIFHILNKKLCIPVDEHLTNDVSGNFFKWGIILFKFWDRHRKLNSKIHTLYKNEDQLKKKKHIRKL